MATIEIQMLGGFALRVDGQPVLRDLPRARKACALVQYLILQRGEPVDHKKLIDALWVGEAVNDPDAALRAVLHRFRTMVEAEDVPCLRGCIRTAHGAYQWAPAAGYTVDAFAVEDLTRQAEREEDPARRAVMCERLLALYTGHLLPQALPAPWVEIEALRLHEMYRGALLEVLEQYKKQEDNARTEALCRRALALDPDDERLYLERIVALENMGRLREAQAVARRGTARGCLHRSVEPGRAGMMCRRVRQADREREDDLQRLSERLPADDPDRAILCDFTTFCTLYRMRRGLQAQQGAALFLALLTVIPGANADEVETEEMMKLLGTLLRDGLRGCDAAARFGADQYVVLQCGPDSGALLEQVKTAFYRAPAHGRYLLTCCRYAPQAAPARRRTRRNKKEP